jgi:glycosyltransferase involved in cell wall biosynthesis
MLRHRFGIPYVLTVHAPYASEIPLGRGRLRSEVAAILDDASTIIVPSGRLRREPSLSEALRTGRLQVVHNPVDFAPFDAAATTPLPGRVVCVGQMIRRKGQAILIEAFAAVRERVPGATLVLVGDGPDRPELESEARALGLEPYVTFTGNLSRPNVLRAVEAAQVFALPSVDENFASVYLEAMLLRKPVISCLREGLDGFVTDGVSGVLVRAHDAAHLADAITSLLVDAARAESIGEAGRALVRDLCSSKVFATRMRAIYDRVTRNPGSP